MARLLFHRENVCARRIRRGLCDRQSLACKIYFNQLIMFPIQNMRHVHIYNNTDSNELKMFNLSTCSRQRLRCRRAARSLQTVYNAKHQSVSQVCPTTLAR